MKHIRYGHAAGRPVQSIVNGPRPIVLVVHANGRMWFFRNGTVLDDNGRRVDDISYELRHTSDGAEFGGLARRTVDRSHFELLVDGEVVAVGDRCVKMPGRKRMVEHYVLS